MTTIDTTMFGVPGKMTTVAWSAPVREGKPTTFKTQRFVTKPRLFTEKGRKYQITATVRFDDDCRNGHNSFCVTGEIYEILSSGRLVEDRFGRCDEEIAKHFPGFKHLQRWNLASTDGPMHGVSGAVYLAGDRDYDGLAKGEPHTFHDETRLKFGNSPISHSLKGKTFEWVVERLKGSEPFEVAEVPHENRTGETYKFDPKYTFKGLDQKWYECPFDSSREAQEWAESLNKALSDKSFVTFHTYHTKWGKGKERELEAARNSLCGMEVTDEELMLPKEELRTLLNSRLPALIDQMRADMAAAGFQWQVSQEVDK